MQYLLFIVSCRNLAGNNLSGTLPYSVSLMVSLSYLWVAILNAMKLQSLMLFSCHMEILLIACFEKSLALGTWAGIHFPSHPETFLLILLASQPCKIPCFNSLFMIYYSISSLAVKWCLVTILWCSKHILQPFSVLSNPLIGNIHTFEIAFAFFMYYSILLVIAGISLSTTFLEIFLVP
jgi:hypothetical protein